MITGSAFGNVISQEETYIEGAPQVYFGSIDVPYMYIPTGGNSQFYWNLSGTTQYPVYSLGCYEGVSLNDNMEINDIRCDTVGNKGVIMRRNFLEINLTLKSFFPFTVLAPILNGGSVVVDTVRRTEFFGLGQVDNSRYYKVYLPKVYDELNGDYVSFTIHRARFVPAGAIDMTYGNQWSMPVTIRAFANTTLPSAQQFATVMRFDPSEIV